MASESDSGAYLTRADVPELVKSVADAMMAQLRKVTLAPEEAGPSHPSDAGWLQVYVCTPPPLLSLPLAYHALHAPSLPTRPSLNGSRYPLLLIIKGYKRVSKEMKVHVSCF